MPSPAVFLDRDGVLIENVPAYVRHWDEVEIFPFATRSLTRLNRAGYSIFVVTNQGIVGKGLMSHEEISRLHEEIMAAVDPDGLVTKSYLCPHVDEDGCDCRKPMPGSLLRAAEEFDLDLAASYMVGDAVTDAEAGLNAGTKAILVRTGRGKVQEGLVAGHDLTVVDDLAAAVDLILSL